MKFYVTLLLLVFGMAISYFILVPFSLKSESPNKTFKLELEEQDKEHTIYCKAYKNNFIIASNLGLYAPPSSSFFSAITSHHKWIADNIFWMGEDNNSSIMNDELVISNTSNVNIAVIAITEIRKQALIIFDINAQSRSTVSLQSMANERPTAPAFAIEGRTESGSVVFSKITEFPNYERYVGALHFCVKIIDGDVLITCRELDGEYSDTKKLNATLEKSEPKSKENVKLEGIFPLDKVKVSKTDCDKDGLCCTN